MTGAAGVRLVREAAARLGVTVVGREPLAGSMSGSVVVAGRTDRHGDVVLKVTGHEREDTATAARRELAVYSQLPALAARPDLLAAESTSDWTAVVVRRYEPMPPADQWRDVDWIALASTLAGLHEMRLPDDRGRWEWPAWPGLNPETDRSALERLWRTPKTATALDVVVESQRELSQAAASLPDSFTHGDCHTDNVLRDGDRLLLADWQSARIAPGSNDISFLLTRAIPSGAEPPRARILDRYCAQRGLLRDEVAGAVRAEQILVLAFQYPAFADVLDADAVQRLGQAFSGLVGQL